MKRHTNWAYRGRRTRAQQREFRDAQRRRALRRWDLVHARRAAEPLRQTRVIEIVIRDSLRPMRRIMPVAEQRACGWSRWAVSENGARVSRRIGRTRLAAIIADSLF